jgi:hypothetical protein
MADAWQANRRATEVPIKVKEMSNRLNISACATPSVAAKQSEIWIPSRRRNAELRQEST